MMPAESLALWQGAPPGSPDTLPQTQLGLNDEGEGPQPFILRGVASPGLYVFRPAQPTGAAVLIIPGGSYEFLSIHAEGFAVARRLSRAGMTCFTLAYRLPGDGWAERESVPLQDAQRAMRVLRALSPGLGFDSGRLGVLGFSAGGHLAAMLATGHADPVYVPRDAADALSARPSFAGLIYPVISLLPPHGHEPSGRALLGPAGELSRLQACSPSLRVGLDTPPCFIVHALDDPSVLPENSIEMALALRRQGLSAETHLFEQGGHGFGVGNAGSPAAGWIEMFLAWVAAR